MERKNEASQGFLRNWKGGLTIIVVGLLAVVFLWFQLRDKSTANERTDSINTSVPTSNSIQGGTVLPIGTIESGTSVELTETSTISNPTVTPDQRVRTPSTRAITAEESQALKSQIEDLYEGESTVSYYVVVAEIINPVFKQVFPEAQLYKIRTDAPVVDGGNPSFTMMAAFRNKNYRMPLDFNQLLFDTGYKLNAENRDTFAQALVVTALPAEMAEQSILCNAGYSIDKDFGSGFHYTYAVDCQVEDIDASIWFWKFDGYFNSGLISWGNLTEYGWRETGKDFTIYPVKP